MRIREVFNNIPHIPLEVEDLVENIVSKVAFDAQELAVASAPYDTGALSSSIYVVTMRSDGYILAVNAARSKRPDAQFSGSESVKHRLNAKIVVPIHYGIYHEMGWASRAAKPFLEPSLMAQQVNFFRAISYALSTIGGSR